MKSKRIAIAGFQHETNCFNPRETTLAHFEVADSWPGLLEADEVVTQTRGMNLPIAGFIDAALEAGFNLCPIIWCAAEPSGLVSTEAFYTISQKILNVLGDGQSFDGIYLDLHGAMVCKGFVDGEGELLRQIRAAVGDEIPLVISLDLHANISPEMVDYTSAISIFRTYPHLDMAVTGARCAVQMCDLLNGARYEKAFLQLPYLIPLHAQCTDMTPCKEIYGTLYKLPANRGQGDIALGFPAADFPSTRASCVAYSGTPQEAQAICKDIALRFDTYKNLFDLSLLDPSTAADEVNAHKGAKPILLADVQDNPGGGATSANTDLLHALVEAKCQSVLMGLFCDPELTERAHNLGLNATFSSAICPSFSDPQKSDVRYELEVIALSDGKVKYSGAMYGGGIATMGQTAAMRIRHSFGNLDFVVTKIPNQCLDLAQFVHLGLDPKTYRAICVKSTVHYRAAFAPICDCIINVATHGMLPCDLSKVVFTNLAKEVIALCE